MIARNLTPSGAPRCHGDGRRPGAFSELMRDSNWLQRLRRFESIKTPARSSSSRRSRTSGKIERVDRAFPCAQDRIPRHVRGGLRRGDVETIDATAEFALKNDIDSIQFMILNADSRSPDWEQLLRPAADKVRDQQELAVYDGHHVVHQPRRMARTSCRSARSTPWRSSIRGGGSAKNAPQGRQALRGHPVLRQADDPRLGGRTTRTVSMSSGSRPSSTRRDGARASRAEAGGAPGDPAPGLGGSPAQRSSASSA